MTDKERQFLEKTKQVLDDSVRDLDGSTRSKLAQARNAALDSRRKIRRRLITWGTPAAGLAAAALLGVLAFNGPGVSPSAVVNEDSVADLDILTSGESLEFYKDIEFYEWLSEVAENEDDISSDERSVPAPVAARTRRGAGRERDGEPGDEFGVAEHGNAGVSRLV